MEVICKSTGTPILFRTIKSPLGEYAVKVCGGGAHSVRRTDSECKVDAILPLPKKSSILESSLEMEDPGVKSSSSGKDPNLMLRRIVEWFHLYFGDLAALEKAFPSPFPFCVPDATPLQKIIWQALQENVRSGNTISYGELAKLVEKPNAARAVGSAMRRNPNVLIVPCHRVLKANSVIGNYSSGGSEIKKLLLEHEKKVTICNATSKHELGTNGVAA